MILLHSFFLSWLFLSRAGYFLFFFLSFFRSQGQRTKQKCCFALFISLSFFFFQTTYKRSVFSLLLFAGSTLNAQNAFCYSFLSRTFHSECVCICVFCVLISFFFQTYWCALAAHCGCCLVSRFIWILCLFRWCLCCHCIWHARMKRTIYTKWMQI